VLGVSAILHAIDQGVRVFDPHPERERLRLERDAGVEEHVKDVACGVPGGQHHRVGPQLLPGLEPHSAYLTAGPLVPGQQRHDAGAEAERHAVPLQALPDGGDDVGQLVAADVGAGVSQYRAGRAVQRQHLEHVTAVAALVGPGVELAVAVRARSPLAEAIVAVRIDDAQLVQALLPSTCAA
jgi:hypothetical protein